jgi:hypothetical protein
MWVNASSGETANKATEEIIKRTVDSLMSEKHLTKVASGPADLHVVYQVAVQQEEQWQGFDPNIPSPQDANYLGDKKIEVGTLVLDMYDSAQQSQRLVWHGKATKTFDQHNDEEAVHKTTEKAIEEMMKKFPPGK